MIPASDAAHGRSDWIGVGPKVDGSVTQFVDVSHHPDRSGAHKADEQWVRSACCAQQLGDVQRRHEEAIAGTLDRSDLTKRVGTHRFHPARVGNGHDPGVEAVVAGRLLGDGAGVPVQLGEE